MIVQSCEPMSHSGFGVLGFWSARVLECDICRGTATSPNKNELAHNGIFCPDFFSGSICQKTNGASRQRGATFYSSVRPQVAMRLKSLPLKLLQSRMYLDPGSSLLILTLPVKASDTPIQKNLAARKTEDLSLMFLFPSWSRVV
jgi:hypothetical protein